MTSSLDVVLIKINEKVNAPMVQSMLAVVEPVLLPHSYSFRHGVLSIARASCRLELPSSFQLVAAMTPCFCGFHRDPQARCRCTPEKVQRYLEKISGPLFDRIDLIVNVPRIAHHEPRVLAVPDNRRKALSEPS